jgi:hypothetical protein
VQLLQLHGDVLNRRSETNDCIGCIFVAPADSHCAHCGDGDRSSSNSSEDLDHAVILATLAAQHFARTTWLAALALSLPGQLGLVLRAIKTRGAGLSFDCHGSPVAILPIRGMAPLPRHHSNDGDGEQ